MTFVVIRDTFFLFFLPSDVTLPVLLQKLHHLNGVRGPTSTILLRFSRGVLWSDGGSVRQYIEHTSVRQEEEGAQYSIHDRTLESATSVQNLLHFRLTMPLKTRLFAIMLFVASVAFTEQSFLPLDEAIPPPTRTLQARHSLTSSTIDFDSLPDCASFFCSPSHWQGPGLCPSVPCPSTSDTSCSTVTTDCFCNLKFPLSCGWILCDWSAWYHFENWYGATCPDAKPVDFSGLPKCVRGCLPDQFILFGCITLGRSCVCQSGELFGCASKCDAQSNTTIETWFADLCGKNTLYEGAATVSPAAHSGVVPRVRPPTPISWYETYAVVVAATSVLVFVVVVVMVAISDKKHRQKPKPKRI